MRQFCGPQGSFSYSRSQSFSGKTVGLSRKPDSKTICIIQPSYLFQKHSLNINNMLFLRLKRKTKYGSQTCLLISALTVLPCLKVAWDVVALHR